MLSFTTRSTPASAGESPELELPTPLTEPAHARLFAATENYTYDDNGDDDDDDTDKRRDRVAELWIAMQRAMARWHTDVVHTLRTAAPVPSLGQIEAYADAWLRAVWNQLVQPEVDAGHVPMHRAMVLAMQLDIQLDFNITAIQALFVEDKPGSQRLTASSSGATHEQDDNDDGCSVQYQHSDEALDEARRPSVALDPASLVGLYPNESKPARTFHSDVKPVALKPSRRPTPPRRLRRSPVRQRSPKSPKSPKSSKSQAVSRKPLRPLKPDLRQSAPPPPYASGRNPRRSPLKPKPRRAGRRIQAQRQKARETAEWRQQHNTRPHNGPSRPGAPRPVLYDSPHPRRR